jgi:Rrf2 family protein
MISQKAKYALRALLALARTPEDDIVLIGDIAERESIPKKFLEQILLAMRNQGLVISRRGKNGGYALLKAPEDITFGHVLRVIDGPIAPLPCLSKTAYRRCPDCRDEAECGIRRVFAEAYEATTDVLDRLTIADAMGEDGARARQARSLVAAA